MAHPACPELRREPQLSPPYPNDLLSLLVFGARAAKLFVPFTFQRVTTINSCNSFCLMTIRIAGAGIRGPLFQPPTFWRLYAAFSF